MGSTRFSNAVNGPVSLGLAMAEEKGLSDEDKLGVIGYTDLLDGGYAFSVRGVATSDGRSAVNPVRQMHAILLATHGVAVKERIAGVKYKSVSADQLPGAIRVSCAYALQAYGFVGWFAVKGAGVNRCRKFISELDTIPDTEVIDWFYSDSVASDIRIMGRQEISSIAQGLTVDKDNEIVEFEYLKSYTTNDAVTRALSVCLATKINFFQTNHHTGQGEMSKFIQKGLNTLYPSLFREAELKLVQDAVHRAGHWMSTHVGLNALGMITGRKVAISPVAALIGKAATNLASDFIARADSLPAGTAPYAVVHATLKEFATNKAFTVAPYNDEMAEAAKSIDTLIKDFKQAAIDRTVDPRLYYHMGSMYLTGSPRKIFTNPAPIGTVGSFLFNIKSSSSLTASPLISKEDPIARTRTKAYEGQYGFNERWEAFCVGMRGVRGRMGKVAQRAMASVTTGGLVTIEAYRKLNEFSSAGIAVADAIYRETSEAMAELPEEEEEIEDEDAGLSFSRKRRRT